MQTFLSASVPSEQRDYVGDGAILLVDGARFLPDDVVASGIRASLLGSYTAMEESTLEGCANEVEFKKLWKNMKKRLRQQNIDFL